MKQSEMIWMCLPQGLDELFEIVKFERTDQAYNIWLDETCLRNGEVWTFLTNKDGKGGRGSLAAAIPGTKSEEIISLLVGAMGKSVRHRMKEVTCGLSP